MPGNKYTPFASISKTAANNSVVLCSPSKSFNIAGLQTANEYWEGSFGVNHSDNQVPERIVIKVYGSQVNYVRALPIHESQKELESNEEYTLFEYHIVPCYNLYQQLLWHREKLEIVEPIHMREEMAKIVSNMTALYK